MYFMVIAPCSSVAAVYDRRLYCAGFEDCTFKTGAHRAPLQKAASQFDILSYSILESNGNCPDRHFSERNFMETHPEARAAVDAVYRADWGRIVATLIRLVGDFDLAEDSAQEAFAAATDQWPSSGIPDSPRAWIIQTARHKAIDRI